MDLARVLERDIPFVTVVTGAFDEHDICGSMASHFKVSIEGTLSFFKVRDDDPSPEEVALAIASTRRTLDDVAWCSVPRSEVSNLGLCCVETPGLTPIDKVNKNHVSVSRVSLWHLTKLILACLTYDNSGRLGMWEVAVEISDGIESGKIDIKSVEAGLLRAIKDGENGRGFKRARKAKDNRSDS